jgi:hypothetical protein
MLLGVASGAVKEVEHSSLFVFEVVGVHLKLPSHLEPLAFEGKVYSIR